MVGIFSRMIVAMTIRMPRWFVRWVSRRYVAGPRLEDAVRIMQKLSKEGACFTVDVLGEEIKNIDEAQDFLKEYQQVIQEIVDNKLDANLSIKPTAFGLLLDEKIGMANIRTIVKQANDHDIFVRLDMEDHRVTTPTIQVVLELHQEGLVNVGTVLQGRLLRTVDDIHNISRQLGPYADYRICKGIYLEPAEIAHTSYSDIVEATNNCIDEIIKTGGYCAIATHDMPVIHHSKHTINAYGLGPSSKDPRPNAGQPRVGKGPGYEFQMLLGVRGPLRRSLAKEGHRTRVYIPYGEKWYEYSIRRLKENPTIGTHIAKSFLMPWTNRP